MSVIEERPHRAGGGGAGDVVLVLVLVAAALLVVLTIVVVGVAGERSRLGPRGTEALDALEADITAAGLLVCSRADVPDPRATDAVDARTLVVADGPSTCGGGGQDGQTALVQADRFVVESDRDAAARRLEGQVRPRASATVRTYGDLVVVVRGGADDLVADRLDAALLARGAR